jgi:hypothetical protein
MDTMDFTKEDVLAFVQAYKKALSSNQKVFEFKKRDFFIDYAKYLLDYFCQVRLCQRIWDNETHQFIYK